MLRLTCWCVPIPGAYFLQVYLFVGVVIIVSVHDTSMPLNTPTHPGSVTSITPCAIFTGLSSFWLVPMSTVPSIEGLHLWKHIATGVTHHHPMWHTSHIYELIGDQIPNFPLTLHWNQKYLKSQDTNSVSLHLKSLPLTFPRRQEQYPRKSIDSLDNRCPWLDWQVILKVTGLYLLHLYQKCTWPFNIGIYLFKMAFSKKPSWPCGSHVTSTGLFSGLSQFTNQDGGLANRTKLTNTTNTMNPKLTRQGGFSGLYFF